MSELNVIATCRTGVGHTLLKICEYDVITVNVGEEWQRARNKLMRNGVQFSPVDTTRSRREDTTITGVAEHGATVLLLSALTAEPPSTNSNKMMCFGRLIDSTIGVLESGCPDNGDSVYEASLEGRQQTIRTSLDTGRGYKVSCEFGDVRLPLRDVQTAYLTRVGICGNGDYHEEKMLRWMLEQEMLGVLSYAEFKVRGAEGPDTWYDLTHLLIHHAVIPEGTLLSSKLVYNELEDMREVTTENMIAEEFTVNNFLMGAETLFLTKDAMQYVFLYDIFKDEKYRSAIGELSEHWLKVSEYVKHGRWREIEMKYGKYISCQCVPMRFVQLNHYRMAEVLLYTIMRIYDGNDLCEGVCLKAKWDGLDVFDFPRDVVEDIFSCASYAELYIILDAYVHGRKLSQKHREQLVKDLRRLRCEGMKLEAFVERHLIHDGVGKDAFKDLCGPYKKLSAADVDRSCRFYNHILFFTFLLTGTHYVSRPEGSLEESLPINFYSFDIHDKFAKIDTINIPKVFDFSKTKPLSIMMQGLKKRSRDSTFCDCSDRFFSIVEDETWEEKWTVYKQQEVDKMSAQRVKQGERYEIAITKRRTELREEYESAQEHRRKMKFLVDLRECYKTELSHGVYMVPKFASMMQRLDVLATYVACRCTGYNDVLSVVRSVYTPKKSIIIVVISGDSVSDSVQKRVARERFPTMINKSHCSLYIQLGKQKKRDQRTDEVVVRSSLQGSGILKVRPYNFLEVEGHLVSLRLPNVTFGTEFFYTKLSAV
uniref:Outer capsid protein VP2 n=1 Tax=Skunk River virus TaxID=2488682 RepID=A0A3S8RBS8_9REOV|nr:VP2 [Skunk River virus]